MLAIPSTPWFPSSKSYKLAPCSTTQIFHYIIIHYILLSKNKSSQCEMGFQQTFLHFDHELFFGNYSVVILSKQFFTICSISDA